MFNVYVLPILDKYYKMFIKFLKNSVGSAVFEILCFFKKNYLIFDFWLWRQLPSFVKANAPFFLIKQNKSLTWKEVIVSFSRRQKTEFYAPLQSFWPIFISFSLGLFLITLVATFHNEKLIKFQGYFLIICLVSLSIGIAFWFSIFFLEKRQGNHNFRILDNIEMGFFLFLFTEALCFISLFWVFLHSMLAASIHIGLYNPGEGISHFFINETIKINENWDNYFFCEIGTPCWYQLSSKFTLLNPALHEGQDLKLHINFYDKGQLLNPYKLPLLNTFILLSSAGTLNLSHLYLKKSNFFNSLFYLFITISLGFFFVCIQFKEYKECSLQYNDGIYAACFFSLTGLHGFHVILGLFCLIICFLNILFLNYSPNYHQSFHYSILYWHFVDIIWILVYFIIYLWPSSYFFTGDIYAVWLNFGYYSVHFDKNIFEKALDNKLHTELMWNNDIIFEVAKGFHSRSDRWKIKWVFCYTDIVHYQYGNMEKVWEDDEFTWEADILAIQAEYFDKTFKFFEKIHPFNLYYLNLEYCLSILRDLKDSFNYNSIKKDPEVFCFVMTIMHDELFHAVRSCFPNDLKYNIKKIVFLSYLIFLNEKIALLYMYYFTPYLFDFVSIRKMFKLREFYKN